MTKAGWMARLHLFLTLFWLALSLPTLLWWSESVTWVVWMSLYAIVATHWSAYQATRAEVQADDKGKEEDR